MVIGDWEKITTWSDYCYSREIDLDIARPPGMSWFVADHRLPVFSDYLTDHHYLRFSYNVTYLRFVAFRQFHVQINSRIHVVNWADSIVGRIRSTGKPARWYSRMNPGNLPLASVEINPWKRFVMLAASQPKSAWDFFLPVVIWSRL